MPPGNAHANGPPGPEEAIRRCARILRGGGIIAYPNESVYGLGCLPADADAVTRILALKDRQRSLGLILIAAQWQQFDGWVEGLEAQPCYRELLESRGVTWVVAACPAAPGWITGNRTTIAVRRSLHPVASALSRAVDSPLVSTSCNPHGKPPALNVETARRYVGGRVDCIVEGKCGPLTGPTEIRDAATGAVLRPA